MHHGTGVRYIDVDKTHWYLASRSSQSSGATSSGLESENFLEAQGPAGGQASGVVYASAFKLSGCHFLY